MQEEFKQNMENIGVETLLRNFAESKGTGCDPPGEGPCGREGGKEGGGWTLGGWAGMSPPQGSPAGRPKGPQAPRLSLRAREIKHL